jgi:hypothetical protein
MNGHTTLVHYITTKLGSTVDPTLFSWQHDLDMWIWCNCFFQLNNVDLNRIDEEGTLLLVAAKHGWISVMQ